MPRTTLTEARVRTLRPRRTAFDIRDAPLKGFGMRVLPSGRKRFFVHCQHRGERIWKIVGDVGTLAVPETRSRAGETLAAIRRRMSVPCRPDESLFEAVAQTAFRHRTRENRATRCTRIASGPGSEQKRPCRMYVFTISVIPMRVSPCGRARPSFLSENCSDAPILKQPSNTRIPPTPWSSMPPRPLAPSSGAEPCRGGNAGS